MVKRLNLPSSSSEAKQTFSSASSIRQDTTASRLWLRNVYGRGRPRPSHDCHCEDKFHQRRALGDAPRSLYSRERARQKNVFCKICSFLRSEVNIELNFPSKLRGARSRLYRRRFLQVNTRWKALAEIYTMHSFAPFSNLNFFVKNRQNFFAIELMNIH